MKLLVVEDDPPLQAALLLLASFSGSLYWGIGVQRAEDQRTELRQLAVSAAAQLPLIAHEMGEPEGIAKFRAGIRVIAAPALQQQRLQWFDARGTLLSEQGSPSTVRLLDICTISEGSCWAALSQPWQPCWLAAACSGQPFCSCSARLVPSSASRPTPPMSCVIRSRPCAPSWLRFPRSCVGSLRWPDGSSMVSAAAWAS